MYNNSFQMSSLKLIAIRQPFCSFTVMLLCHVPFHANEKVCQGQMHDPQLIGKNYVNTCAFCVTD